MCYREVKCIKHICGHETPTEDRRVDCKSSRCRYSATHTLPCTRCSATCKQWLRQTRMVVTRTDQRLCYQCCATPML
ncbi:hypothetical protein F5887DRAFT_934131 [Amanita rubescens]|nr:hypothetical protein F5887DRAFT_934131 [Amanita rubescens]